jgi:hypothetical protein
MNALRTREEIDRLKHEPRYQDPKRLTRYGYKIYSQNEEDGILHEIFRRIGTTNRVFVEFGVGNGLENNTYALLFQGWRGLWLEAAPSQVKKIQAGLPRTIASGQLQVAQAFVTRANINTLISAHIPEKEIDLLSVDIDGNDVHVWDAITAITPRVVVIEYNAKFPPPISYCMQYDQNFIWDGDDNFGASLQYLETHLGQKGYALVGCSLLGNNAFFVQAHLAESRFCDPFTAENHYEPPRYHLAKLPVGHPPAFMTLEKRIQSGG